MTVKASLATVMTTVEVAVAEMINVEIVRYPQPS
jgi:hypothetical protein